MMRKQNPILAAFILLSSQIAFSQVPKKTIVEHFTNTNCSVCASRNPGFYTNLNAQINVLHLAVHPSAPYSSCLLYKQNTTSNDARTNYYSIYGSTPRLVINGTVISSPNYSSSSIFSSYLSLTSPASIRIVQQKFANDSIRATIIIKTEASHTLGALSLFVALAEDTVFYKGTNNEPTHFDVFRKSLSNAIGNAVTLPATVGDSVTFTFSSPSNAIWNFSRIYTMAILQETTSKSLVQAEAVSASTGFVTAGIPENKKIIQATIFPNPTSKFISVQLGNPALASISINSLDGKLLIQNKSELNSKFQIDVSSLPSETYLIHIKTDQGNFSQKFIKR